MNSNKLIKKLVKTTLLTGLLVLSLAKADTLTLKQLQNNGTYVFNQNQEKQFTVVISGLARSGTSMIAHVVENLGIELGGQGIVKEDATLSHMLEQNSLKEFSDAVAQKNNKHDVWGWKRPGSFMYAHKFENEIRNPKYILVFRDTLSTAKRQSISGRLKFRNRLKKTAETNLQLTNFALNSEHPVMLVSYEKALLDKETFVKEVAKFLNLSPSEEQIDKAIKSIKNGNKAYLENSYNKK